MNSKLAEIIKKYSVYPEFLGTAISHPDQPGAMGSTMLHIAAWNGELDDVQALIESGANVNAVGDEGFTPLHSAAIKGRVEAIKLLLKSGADPRMTNGWGKTPLQIAETGQHGEAAEILRKHL